MKAIELQAHLRSLDRGWVDPEKTVDTFKAGDPETEVRGIAVGWMSYRWALEKAIELGCNIFITHEPTYFNHHDNDTVFFRCSGTASKRRFVEESGLVILRCHDLWDQLPGLGIPDSWADLLGFAQPITGEGYFRVYDVAGQTAQKIAQQVAQRTKVFGQAAVQLIGPANKPVNRLALGTGAITPFIKFIDQYQADLAICSDDGLVYWRDAAIAIDLGIPLIVVNHAVTEEAGIINLASYLQTQFTQIPVHHIPQRCLYTLIT